MKKALFVFICVTSCMTLLAQNPMAFSKVIKADSLTKDQVYLALRSKLASSNELIKNYKITFEDKEAGVLIYDSAVPYGKGGFSYAVYDGHVTFNINITIKDGRFKVEITNIIHTNDARKNNSYSMGMITDAVNSSKGGLEKKFHNNVWNDIKEKMDRIAGVIFSECENTALSAKVEETDNW